MLAKGSHGIVFGDSNIGKSFFVLDVAMRLSSEGKNVLYVDLEGSPAFLKNRIYAWEEYYPQREARDNLLIITQGVHFSSGHNIGYFAEAIQDRPLDLIIIDTLSASLLTGDENSVQDIRKVNHRTKWLAEKTQAAVLFVHHKGKDSTKGMRGSSALRGSIDTGIELRQAAEKTTVHCDKPRNSEKFKPYALKLVTNQYGALLIPTDMPELKAPTQTQLDVDSIIAYLKRNAHIQRKDWMKLDEQRTANRWKKAIRQMLENEAIQELPGYKYTLQTEIPFLNGPSGPSGPPYRKEPARPTGWAGRMCIGGSEGPSNASVYGTLP